MDERLGHRPQLTRISHGCAERNIAVRRAELGFSHKIYCVKVPGTALKVSSGWLRSRPPLWPEGDMNSETTAPSTSTVIAPEGCRSVLRVDLTQTRPIADARSHTRETMISWGVAEDVRDIAELIVSELVTNSVTHATGPVVLSLTMHDCVLDICVRDGDPQHLADEPSPTDDAESGRGLQLVRALSESYGCSVHPDQLGQPGYKEVWATVAVTQEASDEPATAA